MNAPVATAWLDSIDADERERVYAAMRSIDGEACRLDHELAEVARAARYARLIGCADRDALLGREVRWGFLRALRGGATPDAAATAAAASGDEAAEIYARRTQPQRVSIGGRYELDAAPGDSQRIARGLAEMVLAASRRR